MYTYVYFNFRKNVRITSHPGVLCRAEQVLQCRSLPKGVSTWCSVSVTNICLNKTQKLLSGTLYLELYIRNSISETLLECWVINT